MKRQHIWKLFLIAFWPTTILADLSSELSSLVGYQIIASKTVVSWRDGDLSSTDKNNSDSFEGCNHGRKIIFSDKKYLTCAEYGYQYAYRPTVIILSNGSNYKMIVEDTIYEMRQ